MNFTIVSNGSIVGIALGSIFGGNLARFGRRKMYLIFSFIGIIGCVLSTFPNLAVMSFGRLVYGFCAGIFCVMGPRIMNETVPQHLMDMGFNSSTNIWINIFTMISMLLGLGQPAVTEEEALLKSNWYKFVYMFPVIPMSIMIFVFLFIHKQESIHFHVVRGEKE